MTQCRHLWKKIVNCHNSNTFTCGRRWVYTQEGYHKQFLYEFGSKSQNMHACMQIIHVLVIVDNIYTSKEEVHVY